ncbi:MAG: VOC family protein [Gloeobacteraceae cyanobacterium ES-bin-144]|nr:VOC family protein [Verrucomicrobiales bacterium]
MKILEFAFIGYPVTDIARARAFYEGVLGLTCTTIHQHSSAVEYEVGPHTLLIGSGPEMKPSSDGPAVALEVENFDEAIAHLKQHEVAFLGEPFESPICRGAFILDPDGNKIGIHKRNIQ